MAWIKEVIEFLKNGVKYVGKIYTKTPISEISMDNVISFAEKAGTKITPVLNDLGECVGYGSTSTVVSNGTTAEVISLFETTTSEVVVGESLAGTVTAGGEALTVGETVTEIGLAESGVAIGGTALSTAGVGILVALGAVAIYKIDPEFWNGVGEKLLNAGDTIGQKVITFFTGEGETQYKDSTIDIIKQEAIKAGILKDSNTVVESDFIYDGGDFKTYEGENGSAYEGLFYQFNLSSQSDTHPYMIYGTDEIKFILLYSGGETSIGGNLFAYYDNSGKETHDKFSFSSSNVRDGILTNESTRILSMHAVFSFGYNGGLADFIYDYSIANHLKYAFQVNFDSMPTLNTQMQFVANNYFMEEKRRESIPEVNPLPEPVEYPNGEPNRKVKTYPIEIPDTIPQSDDDFDTSPTKEKPTPSQDPNRMESTEGGISTDEYPEPNPVPQPAPVPTPPEPNANGDDGNIPSIVPIITGTGDGVMSVFKMTPSEVSELGSYLWSSTNMTDILKVFQNPLDAVISLHKVFCNVSGNGEAEIKLGYLSTGVQSTKVTQYIVTADMGSIMLSEKFHNALDYPPYTNVSIYLPFIGIQQLNAYEVVDSTINVTYKIDILTGACIAQIRITRGNMSSILYEFNGSMLYQIPLTGGNFAQAIANTVTGVVAGAVTGGVAGAILGGSGSLFHSNVEIGRSGGLTSNAGMLGTRTPYLIICHSATYDANSYNKFYGYPSNKTVLLSDCTGYTKVKDIQLHVNCTNEEKEELEEILKGGFII